MRLCACTRASRFTAKRAACLFHVLQLSLIEASWLVPCRCSGHCEPTPGRAAAAVSRAAVGARVLNKPEASGQIIGCLSGEGGHGTLSRNVPSINGKARGEWRAKRSSRREEFFLRCFEVDALIPLPLSRWLWWRWRPEGPAGLKALREKRENLLLQI